MSAVLTVVRCVHSRDGDLNQLPLSLQLSIVFTQGRQPHPVSAVLIVVGFVHSGTATPPSVRLPYSFWLCSHRDGNLTQCRPSLQLLVLFTQGRKPHPLSAVLTVVGYVHIGTATSLSVLRPYNCWLCSHRDGNLTQCPPSSQLLVVFTQGRQPHSVSAVLTFVGYFHIGTATSLSVRLLTTVCFVHSGTATSPSAHRPRSFTRPIRSSTTRGCTSTRSSRASRQTVALGRKNSESDVLLTYC